MTAPAKIQISEINEVHPTILEFENELDLPPFSNIHIHVAHQESLLNVLHLQPLHIKKSQGRFVCVGNIRLYRTARQQLKATTKVPIIIQSKKLSPTKIKELYLAELYLTPIIYQISKDDGRRLFAAWKGQSDDLPHPIPRCNQDLLAKALRIHINTLTKK